MKRFSKRLSAVAAVAVGVSLAIPGYALAADVPPPDGLTRESLVEPGAVPPVGSTTAHHRHHARARRARPDGKDYVFVQHHREHAPAHERGAARVAHAPKRRNPATSFVYWWNGWVIRTFHTKFGTVMLGKIGAKS